MNRTKLFLSGAMSLIDPTGMENLLNNALDSKKQQLGELKRSKINVTDNTPIT